MLSPIMGCFVMINPKPKAISAPIINDDRVYDIDPPWFGIPEPLDDDEKDDL